MTAEPRYPYVEVEVPAAETDEAGALLFERVRVGRHAKIRRAIIDKDVEIPSGTVIGFDREADRQRFHVTERGTVVIPKRAKLDGLV